jgi:MoaA/NifB/PqqE/SkfB family radical SAM enzyme
MTEDVARRSIDWLHDHGCRVLALMGGEPLLRPQFAHKVVNYAAKKGFWIYIGTNGRLLRPEVADRLADAGTAIFNFALDSWNLQPSLPKAVEPVRKNLEYLLRKQYVYGYMVFCNLNICRNNLEDVRKITEFAHENRIALYPSGGLARSRLPDRLAHRPQQSRLPDGEFRTPSSGDEGVHAHVFGPGLA